MQSSRERAGGGANFSRGGRAHDENRVPRVRKRWDIRIGFPSKAGLARSLRGKARKPVKAQKLEKLSVAEERERAPE